MRQWWLIAVCCAMSCADAAQVNVQVLGHDGKPISGLVITVEGATPAADNASRESATMDQVDQRFMPFILPVRTGTAVTFPNSDTIAHQVYSFSPPKRFELGLYRGAQHAPIVFDKPGIVVLGCNIHDKMVGYIYVTDAPFFGKTNEQGRWRADTVPAATYQLDVFSPRLARDEPALRRSIVVSDGEPVDVLIRLTRPVQSEPSPQTDRKLRDY